MLWDLFCRVIDHHGDIGVCWRLAADLAARGERVRLWADDASALAWMAPGRAPGVAVLGWPGRTVALERPGDVVVEAFGCELPAWFVQRMRRAPRAPVWINLEYLTAESFAERAHGLESPRSGGPGAGLRKWFFYPGFTPRTGGLIHEADLMARQRRFDAPAWRAAQGAESRAHEHIVSLWCYPNAALAPLLDTLAQRPTLLLATPGAAAQQVDAILGATLRRGALRAVRLPWLSQRDYDHLLWACDLNFVRGEDSFVRAQWAARPFVWQIYPQHDNAHQVKLDAFLDRHLDGAGADLAARLRAVSYLWNGRGATTGTPTDAPVDAPVEFPARADWEAHALRWRDMLLARPSLTEQLVEFVLRRR